MSISEPAKSSSPAVPLRTTCITMNIATRHLDLRFLSSGPQCVVLMLAMNFLVIWIIVLTIAVDSMGSPVSGRIVVTMC